MVEILIVINLSARFHSEPFKDVALGKGHLFLLEIFLEK